LLTAFATSSDGAAMNTTAVSAATVNAFPNSVVTDKHLVNLPRLAIQSLQMFASFAAVSTCSPIGWSCGSRCKGTIAGTQFVKEFYDEKTETYAYVATNDRYQRIIVSFRGSVDLSSWIQNLNFAKTEVDWLNNDEAKVHAGFLNCYQAVRSDLKNTIASVVKLFPNYTLTFIGHSLGGGK
jgi:hypothetical protein